MKIDWDGINLYLRWFGIIIWLTIIAGKLDTINATLWVIAGRVYQQ